MSFNKILKKKGFTLIETLVGVGVFLVISMSAYQAYISLFQLINLNQYKILALNLANEQFEIIRNLSYADVGVQGSIPNGKIPHIQTLNRGNIDFIVTTTIRNVDVPFDGTVGGSPNDLSPADNKLAEVQVDCSTCKGFSSLKLTTTVAPKNLETASTNGALFIKVFDSNGIPVVGANVHVVNASTTPNIIIDDVTDSNGMLQIVDAPPGVEVYQIIVSKSGYSTDKTSQGSAKPNATVVLQQVTQISFSIDHLSTISFSSVTPECTPVGNIDFNLTGLKQTSLNVPKYSQNLVTDASGIYSNSNMEWDSYIVTGTDTDYDIIGINPLNPIALNPNSTQNVSLIVAPKNPKSLLITIKDNTTQLPITDAIVHVTSSSPDYDSSKITGRGFINQTAWSGGSGQTLFTDNTKYFADDGNVDVANPSGEIKLKDVFGSYNSSAELESSTIDAGSPSNFYNLIWTPIDQPVLAGTNSVKFQLASNLMNTATTTWNYKGPDGTNATYYTSPNSSISSIHNGNRFIRYKLFLNTDTATATPNISDISLTETSSCTPPGQVIFDGLEVGTYYVEVGKTGYATSTADINVNTVWQEKEIILTP